jgi:transcriptional regulator with XRE-family HTH domain
MEVRKRIGANVRRLREGKGLSQEKFGFESGIDRTYVSGIERDARNPTATIIEKIAAGLGVPAYVLLMEPERDDSDKVRHRGSRGR